MKRHMRAISVLFLVVVCMFSAAGAVTAYRVRIGIDFQGNLLFSTYGVDFFLNDLKMETLKHGEDYSGRFYAEAGTITLHFYEHGKNSPHGSVNVKIEGNTAIRCTISCHSDSITVSNVSVVNEDASSGATATPKPSPVPTQEAKATPAPARTTATPTPTAAFPKETAKKAVMTAICNNMSLDVFTEDGNDLDPKKFHNYSYCARLITVKDEGDWTVLDGGEGWHVERFLVINKTYGGYFRYSFDIRFDGKDYRCENGFMDSSSRLSWLESKSDPSKYSENDLSNLEYYAYCIVSPAQIDK